VTAHVAEPPHAAASPRVLVTAHAAEPPHAAASPRVMVLSAFELAKTPRATRVVARLVLIVILLLPGALVFVPWQQQVHGEGRAVAFNPIERSQFVVAPIQGRISRWAVVEGKPVKAGDLLVEMVDVDPLLPQRLQDEEFAVVTQQSLALGAVEEVERRITNLELGLQAQIQQINLLVLAQTQNVTAVDQAINAAAAPLEVNKQEIGRLRAANAQQANVVPQQQIDNLAASIDRQEFGLKQLGAQRAQANETLNATKKSVEVLGRNTAAQIDGERASLNRARGDVQNLGRQLLTVQSRIARQRQQNVYAPTDGTVFRILENGEAGGQLVNPGQRLATLVPDIRKGPNKDEDRKTAQLVASTWGLLSAAPLASVAGTPQIATVLAPPSVLIALTRTDDPGIVAELLIDGNDLPLVQTGDPTVLQFEGWPAVQFVGMPEAATGTFAGRVYLIDPTSNERGQFRILVEPDPDAEPWPNQELLRQGVRAQGWVLMPKRVRLGWELWRQVNGFPPFREPQTKRASGTSLGPVQRK